MPNRLVRATAVVYEKLLRYLLKFGVVGAIGFVVDFAVFNWLLVGGLGEGHFLSGPIGAKVAAVAAATVVTWFGNRYWTFREHRRRNYIAELFEFSVVAVAGLLINVLCLWFSHYVLGFTSILADNISGQLIGTLLATLFRFVLYRYWVFGRHRGSVLADPAAAAAQLDAEQKAELAAASIFEDDSYAEADAARENPHL
ncbi:GtrA family protein [Subtercola endophyticus]|uniref:GtrA family protein n=1 Tax=Subtercola endophyticus TaxID=2895559 RepID=UPI001E4F20BA|nr:GtrA family protein [Subtercola endophyticus]UFS57744.1 GtrA family protein [Subtercola endophyticus]